MAVQTLRTDVLRNYELGTEILFGKTGNANSYMGIGWSSCQSNYCWTMGNIAELTLPVEMGNTDLEFQVRFKPFIDEIKSPQQRIGVSVNGTQLTEWLVSNHEPQNQSLIIPAELAQGEALQIRFHFPDAVSPKELGLSIDTRPLGIAMQYLRVDTLKDN